MIIRVLLADDNAPILAALEAVLSLEDDIEVVFATHEGLAAVRMNDELEPDVVVLDRSMPDLDGLDATRQIKRARPHVAIVMITAHAEASVAQLALDAGVSGYLMKDEAVEQLAPAIRAVAAKRVYLSPRVANALFR